MTPFSLRVLMFLAADPERRATIAEIARTFEISENHLMKVVHLLGKAGLLANVRGKGGGLQLAKAPDAINIGKVVRTTEGRPMPAECFDRERNRCVITPICKLRHVLGRRARCERIKQNIAIGQIAIAFRDVDERVFADVSEAAAIRAGRAQRPREGGTIGAGTVGQDGYAGAELSIVHDAGSVCCVTF